MNEIIQHLITAPDSQLDASAVEEVKKWADPPQALEVLKTLDRCVYASLCSGFVVTVMDIILKEALKRENLTMEQLVEKATWRKKDTPFDE